MIPPANTKRTKRVTIGASVILVLTALVLSPTALAEHDRPVIECDEDSSERIRATQHADGRITLEWDAHYGAGFNVDIVRSADGGEWEEMVTRFEPDAWTDTNTTVGTTYEYRVHSTYVGAEGWTPDPLCVEATAIPFFGAPLVVALGTVGAVGAYGLFTRRDS